MTVMSACDAPVALFLLESLCQGATMKRSLHLHPMVTPCLSALWDLDFLFQGCQCVHHSFRMPCSSSMLSGTVTFRACRLARSTRSRHQPSCPPMSQTVSSRLLCSTLSTLELVAGVTVVAVSNVSPVEVRGLPRIVKTRHHELHFLLSCRTFLLSRAR